MTCPLEILLVHSVCMHPSVQAVGMQVNMPQPYTGNYKDTKILPIHSYCIILNYYYYY